MISALVSADSQILESFGEAGCVDEHVGSESELANSRQRAIRASERTARLARSWD